MALSSSKAEEKMKAYRESLAFFGIIQEMLDPDKRKQVADEIAEAFAVPEALKKQAADAHEVIAKAEDHKASINSQCDAFEEYADGRTKELDDREQKLKEFEQSLNEKEASLNIANNLLENRKRSLDDREARVAERENGLQVIKSRHDIRELKIAEAESANLAKKEELERRENAVIAEETRIKTALGVK